MGAGWRREMGGRGETTRPPKTRKATTPSPSLHCVEGRQRRFVSYIRLSSEASIDGDHHSVTTHSKSECVPRTFLVVDIVEQGSSGSLSEEPCNVLDIFRKQ